MIGRKVARSPSIYPDDPDSAHYDPDGLRRRGAMPADDEADRTRTDASRVTTDAADRTTPRRPDDGRCDRDPDSRQAAARCTAPLPGDH